MQSRSWIRLASMAVVLSSSVFIVVNEVAAQRGRGGGGGGRSAGHAGGGGMRSHGGGPAMTRPQPKLPSGGGMTGGNRPNLSQGAAAGGRLPQGLPSKGGANLPTTRPTTGPSNFQRPGAAKPSLPGNIGSGSKLPGSSPNGKGTPGSALGSGARPGTRPAAGPTSDQLSEFLGGKPSAGRLDSLPTTRPSTLPGSLPGRGDSPLAKDRPLDNRPGAGSGLRPGENDRPVIGTRPGENDRPVIGNRDLGDRTAIGSRDVNIGDVKVGNQVDFSKDSRQWIDNRHADGNRVRENAGDRYWDDYRSGAYRRWAVGGYPYYAAWGVRGPYYAWTATNAAMLGAFLGSSMNAAQPVYYAYGSGGNVYYENNTTYVTGQASGTPEEFAQQAMNYVAAAPAAETQTQAEWLPLGVFALSSEEVADSNAMIELAVSKQGVLAGTYYNEATSASRPLKGTVDTKSQRAVVGFGDGKNSDLALEVGLYNLTQAEAPALLHHGTQDSQPMLLVRLDPPPSDTGK